MSQRLRNMKCRGILINHLVVENIKISLNTDSVFVGFIYLGVTITYFYIFTVTRSYAEDQRGVETKRGRTFSVCVAFTATESHCECDTISSCCEFRLKRFKDHLTHRAFLGCHGLLDNTVLFNSSGAYRWFISLKSFALFKTKT